MKRHSIEVTNNINSNERVVLSNELVSSFFEIIIHDPTNRHSI